MNKLNELQENSNRQFSELRIKINKRSAYQKDWSYKKEPINEIASALESPENKADQIKVRFSEFKDTNLEMTRVEEEKELGGF